jgi:hypothetical protein
MQRYDFTLPPGDEHKWHFDEGDFVLHSDAQTEIAAAEQRGRQEERAAIVAHLNRTADEYDDALGEYTIAHAFWGAAAFIQDGDHHAHGHKEG